MPHLVVHCSKSVTHKPTCDTLETSPTSASFSLMCSRHLPWLYGCIASPASGNPSGTTHGFSDNPVTPPGTSDLSIDNTAAANPGSYSIDVEGEAADTPSI